MIKPSRKLKTLVGLFPSQRLFADKIGIDVVTVSRVINEERNMPDSMIEGLKEYLSWPLDDLVEIDSKED